MLADRLQQPHKTTSSTISNLGLRERLKQKNTVTMLMRHLLLSQHFPDLPAIVPVHAAASSCPLAGLRPVSWPCRP